MESLRAKIPLGVLTHHDRLRSRGRQSVAEVRHGVCSGCHMSLPTGLQAEIQRESTLLECKTCGRFIFPTTAVGTGNLRRRNFEFCNSGSNAIKLLPMIRFAEYEHSNI